MNYLYKPETRHVVMLCYLPYLYTCICMCYFFQDRRLSEPDQSTTNSIAEKESFRVYVDRILRAFEQEKNARKQAERSMRALIKSHHEEIAKLNNSMALHQKKVK